MIHNDVFAPLRIIAVPGLLEVERLEASRLRNVRRFSRRLFHRPFAADYEKTHQESAHDVPNEIPNVWNGHILPPVSSADLRIAYRCESLEKGDETSPGNVNRYATASTPMMRMGVV